MMKKNKSKSGYSLKQAMKDAKPMYKLQKKTMKAGTYTKPALGGGEGGEDLLTVDTPKYVMGGKKNKTKKSRK
jgi:hypothetical protein